MWAIALIVVSLVGFFFWRQVRKNVSKEIAHDIARETEAERQRMVEHAERIESDTTDPDQWL